MNVAGGVEVESVSELRVHSDRFGDFTVPEDKVLTLPEGLIGFPNYHSFVVMEHPTPSLLRWLLCLDAPDLAFAVADPSDFFPDYRVWPHEELDGLGLERADDVAVLAIITIPGDPSAMSANLMAPVVVNVGTRVARQIILDNGLYSTRHPLLGPSVQG